jgi:hypothetical protein
MRQAVALSFDSFSATWTKFLHSDPGCLCTQDALQSLLRESEKELTKLLSTNCNSVPFQGIMVQNVNLCRGQRKYSSGGSSVQSESSFIATPGSTSSDTVSNESINGNYPIKEVIHKEPSADNAPIEEAVVEGFYEKPLADEPDSVSEEPVPPCIAPEPILQETQTISLDWSPGNISKKDKKKKGSYTFDELDRAFEFPTEALEVLVKDSPAVITTKAIPEIRIEEPSAKTRVDENKAEATHAVKEVCSTHDIVKEAPVDQPKSYDPNTVDVDGWGGFSFSKKDKKTKKKNIIVSTPGEISTPPLEPEQAVEPAEDLHFSEWSLRPILKKKKTVKLLVEEVPPPAADSGPELQEPIDDFNWSNFSSSKKKKKKKGKTLIEDAEAELVPEPVDDFGFGSWGTTKKKKKAKTLIEEELLPAAELVPEPVDDFSFGGWGTTKKKKAIRLIAEDKPPSLNPEPVLEPVKDIEWSSFDPFHNAKQSGEKLNNELHEVIEEQAAESVGAEAPKEAKLDDFLPTPPHCELQLGAEDGVQETLRPETLPLPESVGHPQLSCITSLPQQTFHRDHKLTLFLQPQVALNRRVVIVVTIQFPNDIGKQPVHAMIAIADNTRTAIINAVNSYLDLKSMLESGTSKQGQRKLEIKYGVGRIGNVDLSALEETMWPEYLDYFRQHTRIPELTVSVVDC